MLFTGCAYQKTAMVGIVDIVEDDLCIVEIINESEIPMWVKLNKRQMKKAKEGDKVIFYVRIDK